ncbi:unnamed protein product [Sympodiomycopsis kandeliae]
MTSTTPTSEPVRASSNLEPSATPKPFPALLPTQEKSLPPPPLDEILSEMPSTPRSPRSLPPRESSDTYVEHSMNRQYWSADAAPAHARESSDEVALAKSPRMEDFKTPELWPTTSNSSPTNSPRPNKDGSALEFSRRLALSRSEQELNRSERFSPRRHRLQGSRSSSNASSHHTPIHELPDPSTFPIPPSPGIPHDLSSPGVASSSRHISSDLSSGCSQSTRGSTWSSLRGSRNDSWDTHHSSPCSTSCHHQTSKAATDGLGSSTESGPVTPLEGEVDAVSKLRANDDKADHCDEDVGLGITSEVECARNSRIAIRAPVDASKVTGRWAHHRAPSWAWRCHTELDEGKPLSGEDGSQGQLADRVLFAAAKPPFPRMMSQDRIATQSQSSPSMSALNNSLSPRSRAFSEVSLADRKASIHSLASSSGESTTSRSAHSPVPFAPRTSSLKRSMRREVPVTGANANGRSTLRSKAGLLAASGPPSHSQRSSIKSVEELVESELESVRGSRKGSDASSKFAPAGHHRSTSAASSVMSLDVASLALDFPHALGTPAEDVSNAVKFAENGQGIVVDARGRDVMDVEPEIGLNTTHLILSGCKCDDWTEFLERVVTKAGHCLLVLDISNTGLQRVPECILQCSELEELNLSCNPLKQAKVPLGIGNFSKLRILALDELELTALPFVISELKELKVLSARRNQLTHLPSWLHLLKGLERLYVHGNDFQGPWRRVLASILPRQVEYSPENDASASQGASLASSVASHGNSPSVSPVSEIGQLRRRPFLQRMRSDNDFRGGNVFDPSVSPKQKINLHFDGRLRSGSTIEPNPMHIEEAMQRRGLVGPEVIEEGGAESKWNFLRRVSRKSSQGKSLAQLAAMTPATGKPASSGPASGQASPVNLRKPSVPDIQSLPKLNTNFRMTRSSQTPSVTPGLGAPFQEAAPISHQERNDTPATAPSHSQTFSGLTPPASQASKRLSFLPVQSAKASAGHPPTEHKVATAASIPDEEDAEDEKRRLNALMCYVRDLDDLSRHAIARRGQRSRCGPMPSNGEAANSHGPERAESSPIRRRPSGMLLSNVSPLAILPQSGEVKDDSTRRKRIIQEIISSEESYIKGLQELVDIYVKPARKPADGTNGQPILGPAEHRTIFGNVEGLVQFHCGAFLPSLRIAAKDILLNKPGGAGDTSTAEAGDAALTAGAAEAIAGVFTKHAAFFRMYSAYINGCDEAQARITTLLASSASSGNSASSLMTPLTSSTSDGRDGVSASQRKKFKAFMKKCRMNPRHSQLNVESYLLLPVQRIPRYELLLKDLARSTDPKHLRSADSVNAALKEISAIAASVNESKRQSEQDRKLLGWQSRIRGPLNNPLVQPHRRLVRDGTLTVRRVVNRMHAFDTNVVSPEDAMYDGAFASGTSSTATSPVGENVPPLGSAPGENLNTRTVDCLRQSSPNQQVTFLLCNDCCFALRETLPSQNPLTNQLGDSRPVELYSVLNLSNGQSGTTTAQPNCAVIGPTTLRMVDAHCVYYFSTQTPAEAVSWCKSINGAGDI